MSIQRNLVVNSKRNSREFQRISDSGPFFDPIFSDSDSGSERKTRSRQVCAFFIRQLITFPPQIFAQFSGKNYRNSGIGSGNSDSGPPSERQDSSGKHNQGEQTNAYTQEAISKGQVGKGQVPPKVCVHHSSNKNAVLVAESPCENTYKQKSGT